MDEKSSITVLADRKAVADQEAADKQAAVEAADAQRLADEQAIAEAAEAQRVADVQAQQQYVPPAPAAPVPAVPAPVPAPAIDPAPAPAAYYKNCTAARNAGAAPVYAGQPGYGSHLDRDGDGIGCE